MKEVIEKLYAKELNLIAERPVLVREKVRGQLFRRLKEKYWTRQTTSVKVAIVAYILLMLSASVYYYNYFISEVYKVRLEAAQIEAEIQRRNDLIPALVKAVSEYMTYEGKVFVHAAEVRNALGLLKNEAAQPVDALALSSFKSALSKFQAVAENYPDLKSSVTYQHLMSELSNTETRLAMARAKYNIAANMYNSSLEMVPGFFFAHLLGFSHLQTFVAEKAPAKPTGAK